MRRVVALAVGLVLSTLLLGGGWMLSALRERETRVREAQERLMRTADAVRGAVDESLEELRAREDHRPFYLYNHFYSPPDVLAISDPVAISPLAHPPDDPRLVGHFQVDPGGAIRTPYTPDATSPPPELARRVSEVMGRDAFAPIRALAVGEGSTMLAGRIEGPREMPSTGDGAVSALLGMRTLRQPSAQPEIERPAPQDNEAEEPLTALNQWGNMQAMDIVAAQQGDEGANRRLMERGRQVPVISRRDVTWEEAQSQQAQSQQAPSQQASSTRPRQQRSPSVGVLRALTRPSTNAVARVFADATDEVVACGDSPEVVVRVSVRGADGQLERVSVDGAADDDERACVESAMRALRFEPFGADTVVIRYAYRAAGGAADAPEIADSTGLDNMVQIETEVDYTPMVFRELDGALVMHRIVSHEGVSVVQGVLLDRGHLFEAWIPSLVSRHSEPGATPSVVSTGAGECALREPASAILSGVELCFAPAALAVVTADLDRELGLSVGALVALLAMALLAAFLIVSAARRAEALSRQKSAFVSAVSHELRTPLTTLRMHAEMLEEGLVKDERRDKVHRELVRESVRLARLVDNVLSLSKLEEGRRRLRMMEGDLRSHVRESVEGQRRFVEEKGFTLVAPEKGTELSARFDAQAIEQIVVNLIDNAVKYGGAEAKEIEVWVGRRDGRPAIVVKDRGPGIPQAEREKVFERFHRVERPETAHAPGTGIGLALVEELAEAHGGHASVHPREGGGLEVVITLGA